MRITQFILTLATVFLSLNHLAKASGGLSPCQEIKPGNGSNEFAAWIDYSEGCRNSFMRLNVLVQDEDGREDVIDCGENDGFCKSSTGAKFKSTFQDEANPRILTLAYSDRDGKPHIFKCELQPW